MQIAKPNRQRKTRRVEDSRDYRLFNNTRFERLRYNKQVNRKRNKKKRRYATRRSLPAGYLAVI
ncbi:unnamed protein product [marine sediment metagenome]|uniref:Uncharacterized protein n=1 Tax=marine sediment metagenome TaxID=412755 RepID=X1U3K0_9ZZZZ